MLPIRTLKGKTKAHRRVTDVDTSDARNAASGSAGPSSFTPDLPASGFSLKSQPDMAMTVPSYLQSQPGGSEGSFVGLPAQNHEEAGREGLTPSDQQRGEFDANWSGYHSAGGSSECFYQDARSFLEIDEEMRDPIDNAGPVSFGEGDHEIEGLDVKGSNTEGFYMGDGDTEDSDMRDGGMEGSDTEDGNMEDLDMDGRDMVGGDMDGSDKDGSDMDGSDTEGSGMDGSDMESRDHQEERDAELLASSKHKDHDTNPNNGNINDSSEVFDISVGSGSEDSEMDDTEAGGRNSSASSGQKISHNRLLTSLVSHQTTSFFPARN
ncbi:hypothetical protein EI94DRAFT_1813550 [Lactarius quietus]|nr:hypothetical protein EI94DRAFT_1813550 [Lactarius quietus]